MIGILVSGHMALYALSGDGVKGKGMCDWWWFLGR